MDDPGFALGRRLVTSNAWDKVRGSFEFAADLPFRGLLSGAVLRSPHPHARIRHMDLAAARRMAGVVAVVTGQEFAGRYGPALTDQPVLARDVVRYAGEPVVAVAAREEGCALEALEAIRVDYEPLPPVLSAEQALQPESPLVHPDLDRYTVAPGVFPKPGTNICNHFRLRRGDIQRALDSAAHVLTHRLTTQKTQHASLEPHVSIARADAAGRVQLWTNTQTPFVTRRLIAEAFGLPVSQVRITVAPPGGGFGGKAYARLEPLAVALALRSGNRPVRLVQTREEEFCGSTVTRHPTRIEVTTGLSADGTILARQTRLLFDTGAYADIGPRVCRNAGFSSAGPYVVPNVAVDAYCVYTHSVPAGAMRGFGIPQVTWAIENHTDMIAHQLGFDPLAFRLQNAIEEGSLSPTGQVLHSVGVKETLQLAAQAIGWEAPRRPGVGRGVACGHKSTVSPSASSCVMRINEDGSVHLLISTVDMGQGAHVALAQMAAEELGIQPDRIVVTGPDTDVTPYDMATVSSRSTFFMGNAVLDAARKLKERILDLAAEVLEANRADLVYQKGRVHVAGSPSRGLDLHQVPQGASFYAGARAAGRGKPLVCEGISSAENATPLDPATGQGENPSAFWMYFAQAAEVAVDVTTGRVKVLRIASAHDVGRIINPQLLEGQIEGACLLGLGEALYEDMLQHNGIVMNPGFLDYQVPTFNELPEIVCRFVENPHRDGPFGAKGVGEPAQAAVAAAVANAIYDAVGVRVFSLPITPEKILQALKAKSGRGAVEPGS